MKEQLIGRHMIKSMEQSQGPRTIKMALTEHAVYVCDMCVMNAAKHFTVNHLISLKLHYFKVFFFTYIIILYEETIIP